MKFSKFILFVTAALSISLTVPDCVVVARSFVAQSLLNALNKIGITNTLFRVEHRATAREETARNFEVRLQSSGAKLRDEVKNTGATAWTATTYSLPTVLKGIFAFVVRQRTYGETRNNELIEDIHADKFSKYETKVPLPRAIAASEGSSVVKTDVLAPNGLLEKIAKMEEVEGVEYLLKLKAEEIADQKKIPLSEVAIEPYRDLMLDYFKRVKLTTQAFKTFLSKDDANSYPHSSDPNDSLRYVVIYNRTAYKKTFTKVNANGKTETYEVQFTFDRNIQTSFSNEINIDASPREYLKQALSGTGLKFTKHNDVFGQPVTVVEVKAPIDIEKKYLEVRASVTQGVKEKVEKFKTEYPDFYEMRIEYEDLIQESASLGAKPGRGKALNVQAISAGID